MDILMTVTVKEELSHPPSATLWLVKWLLLIPHYIIVGILNGGFWMDEASGIHVVR